MMTDKPTEAEIEAGTTELLAIINGKGGGPRESVIAIWSAMQSASPRVGTGFNTQDQAEAAAMQSASPRPTGDVEAVANKIAAAVQKARDDFGATPVQRMAFGYAEAAMRSALPIALATLQPADPVEANAVIGTCHSCDVPHKVEITATTPR